jgi:hypothetical protein
VHDVEGYSAPVYSGDWLHCAVVELITKPGARTHLVRLLDITLNRPGFHRGCDLAQRLTSLVAPVITTRIMVLRTGEACEDRPERRAIHDMPYDQFGRAAGACAMRGGHDPDRGDPALVGRGEQHRAEQCSRHGTGVTEATRQHRIDDAIGGPVREMAARSRRRLDGSGARNTNGVERRVGDPLRRDLVDQSRSLAGHHCNAHRAGRGNTRDCPLEERAETHVPSLPTASRIEPAHCGALAVADTLAGVDAVRAIAGGAKARRTGIDKAAAPIPDLVKRDCNTETVDQRWCGDLTEIPTDEG